MPGTKNYQYREGAHGEHCIDYGEWEWVRRNTVGRAATKIDAINLVQELNEQLPDQDD